MKASHRLALAVGLGILAMYSVLLLASSRLNASIHVSHDSDMADAAPIEQETASDRKRFEKLGYQIKKGNVKFAFTDPKKHKKAPNPKDVLKYNNDRYNKVVAKQKVGEPKNYDLEQIRPPKRILGYPLAKATIYAFVRNEELDDMVKTITSFEESFNAKFQYPYTLFSNEPHSQQFKEKILSLTKAPVYFYLADPQFWDVPRSVNLDKMLEGMDDLSKKNVPNAKLLRQKNRFNLVMLPRLPMLDRYQWFWRIESGAEYLADVNYDVFKYLENTKKVFGFTLNVYGDHNTVGTLWKDTVAWLNENNNYKYVDENGAFQWLTENLLHPAANEHTGGYSGCEFPSSFQIGNLDFFRSKAYLEFTNMLDASNNFFYQAWNDALVQSIALGLFANKQQIHWFRDMAFRHLPYTHCPFSGAVSGCDPGVFSEQAASSDKNCMANWIDYSMKNPLDHY